MPRKITPCVRACCHADCKSGASSAQGAHQDAQKLMTIGLPLRFARCIGGSARMLRAARVKSGAALPMSGSFVLVNVLPVLLLFKPGAGVISCDQSRASSPIFNKLITVKIMMLRFRDLPGLTCPPDRVPQGPTPPCATAIAPTFGFSVCVCSGEMISVSIKPARGDLRLQAGEQARSSFSLS